MMFLATCVLYSCASGRSFIDREHLIIKKIPSDNMRIVYVYADNDNGETKITGKVRFNKGMIGTPSDHLAVTIFDPGGNRLYSARTGYHRIGNLNRVLDPFRISLTIPEIIPNGSTIRLKNVES
jgi:hypothetical protein